jgi:hypothetical protein
MVPTIEYHWFLKILLHLDTLYSQSVLIFCNRFLSTVELTPVEQLEVNKEIDIP